MKGHDRTDSPAAGVFQLCLLQRYDCWDLNRMRGWGSAGRLQTLLRCRLYIVK